MFKVLILAARNNVSDERMEFLIRARLSWLRFLGFDLGKPAPDENTIALFRERLTNAGATQALFDEFDQQLKGLGHLPMGGQIVDATLISAHASVIRMMRKKPSRKASLPARFGLINPQGSPERH